MSLLVIVIWSAQGLGKTQVELEIWVNSVFAFKEKDNFELLVAPQSYNKLYCQSYIIVYGFSAISNFVDLEGKSFAVMDQTTNTSKIFMDHKLRTLGFTWSRFF